MACNVNDDDFFLFIFFFIFEYPVVLKAIFVYYLYCTCIKYWNGFSFLFYTGLNDRNRILDDGRYVRTLHRSIYTYIAFQNT